MNTIKIGDVLKHRHCGCIEKVLKHSSSTGYYYLVVLHGCGDPGVDVCKTGHKRWVGPMTAMKRYKLVPKVKAVLYDK